MRSYLARRLMQFIPTFLGVTVITFALLQLAPGDPAGFEIGSGSEISQSGIEQWRKLKGLNEPVGLQYLNWLWAFVRFEFGNSLIDERPVRALIGAAIGRTLLLASLALALIYALGVALGVMCAVRQGKLLDSTLSTGLFVLHALPTFWIALLLIVFLGGGVWDIFPIRGLRSPNLESAGILVQLADLGWHLVLPLTCLTLPSLARISRFARSSMLEVLSQDYIRTARAKGLSESTVILRHALKNSLLPVLTLLSADLPWLFGGSVIVERIFTIHGMGMLAFESVLKRDYPVIMGIVALVAIITMLSVLLADLAYAAADPRIRLGEPK